MTDEIKARPEKVTLHKFVEENYKLITGMAAFIALTGFTAQIGDGGTKTYLAALYLPRASLPWSFSSGFRSTSNSGGSGYLSWHCSP